MEFQRFVNHSLRGWVDPRLKLPNQLLEDLTAFKKLPSVELILSCRGRTIYKALLNLSGKPSWCYVYLFHNGSFSRALRSNYAYHSLNIASKLLRNGFKTIHVLAALKPKMQFLNWKGLLIAREIPDVKELPSEGSHFYQVHQQVEFDQNLQLSLARELARLHDQHFTHGDLKTRHILTRQNGNGTPSIYFVDLEKTEHHPLIPSLLMDIFATRDLIQLFASLPPDSNGCQRTETQNNFFSHYFSFRALSPFRRAVIGKLLNFYKTEGGLNQGKTLARVLFEKFRSHSKNGWEEHRMKPNQTENQQAHPQNQLNNRGREKPLAARTQISTHQATKT
jgi:hypothetical protein